MATIEDIKKLAIEKKMPKRGLDDMIRQLSADHPDGHIDNMQYLYLCAYIDRQAEYWEYVRGFLKKSREERAERKKEG